jgi:spore germination cell wall hydrolase CwlJ-like protein
MNDVPRSVITSSGAEVDARAAELRFVTRGVTDEEAAAVTAVVLAALDESGGAASVADVVRNPWVRSAHSLRSPFEVGPGNWSRATR